jgi:hypothetical protein
LRRVSIGQEKGMIQHILGEITLYNMSCYL